MTTTNPRRAAFDILLRIERERSFADILIDQELSRGALQGPDRGLLTELVYGVLRRRGTLDHIIGRFSRQRLEKLEQAVLILLRVGLYQLFFLDRVPASAAVNETVKLAHLLAPRATGFINAVLRSANRERDTISYPDRVADPAGFISTRHSTPRWIAEEWISQLGYDEAEALAMATLETPPLTIRVNTLKTSREGLLSRLAEEGIAARAAEHSPCGVHITGPVHLATLPSFREGLFTVQDEASQLAVMFLDPAAGERVLDLCAAPGGKATYMAQIMGNHGSILASDAHGRKLRFIEESANRLGISIIETILLDATRPLAKVGGAFFDRILVDAPCSGLGVVRRNPEGKWWKTRDDLVELSRLQKTILGNGADRLVKGGRLLYATCSTTTVENEGVIDDFLSRRPDFVLEDLREIFPAYAPFYTASGCFRSWPHRHGMDGFFAARLLKFKG